MRRAIDGASHPLQGTPASGGLFPSGKPAAALAQKAIADGLLTPAEPPEPAKTKGKKAVAVHVRITDKGRQFVEEGGDTTGLLAVLGDVLATQGKELADGCRTLSSRLAQYEQTAQALQATLARLRRPPPTANGSPMPAPASPSLPWLDKAVQIITEQKRQNAFERLTLPRLLEHLKKSWPALTLGQFHDGLRHLQEQRRIRLTAYTQALATLPDAQNALYLDREVKYYVDLP